MLTKQTLNSIQSGSLEDIYPLVTDTALYMATGGFLKQGNQLLSELWKYKLPHDRNTWLPDIAFTILWDAAGSRTEFIPFDLQNIERIEKQMRAYIAIDRWGSKLPDGPWAELKGQNLLRKAFITAMMLSESGEPLLSSVEVMQKAVNEPTDDNLTLADRIAAAMASLSHQTPDRFPSKETELEALAMLEKLAAEDFPADDALALGAELAARHGEMDRAAQLIKQWGKLFLNPLTSNRIVLLSSSRHVAPLLLQGVLADELKLSETNVNSFLTEATQIIDKRLSEGPSLAYGTLDWKKLLEELSKAAISLEPEMFDRDVINAGWIGFQGVSPENIAEAEKRLGISLPEDYKGFLLVSDGIRSFAHCNPELAGASEIDYLKNIVESDTYRGLCDFPVYGMEVETLKYLLSRSILISRYPDEQLIWLSPPLKEGASWETWFFAFWLPGERRHPGFRYFIEHQLTSIINPTP